jgi:molybdopterin-containing oxidoreductase family iron-sulfur binding subunit
MNPDDVMTLFGKGGEENTKDNRRDFLYIGQESPAKLATITVNGVSMTLPIVPQPGQALGALSIAVGYGRAGTELFTREEWLGSLYNSKDNTKNTIGQNVFPLAGFDVWTSNVVSTGVTIEAAEGEYPMATTQTHHTMMGRKLVNETTLSNFIDQKGNAKGKGSYNEQIIISDSYGEAKTTKELDLWAEHAIDLGHRWGLSIDLNLCIGCGSCVTACHLENNVAVVGKDEVRRSREMHWLRIDRYYSSTIEIDGEKLKVTDFDDLPNAFAAKQAYLDAEVSDSGDDVSVVYQPIMCQHCNHAPCETVCPVAATTHSNEGMNQMTYNRCVGTRYCANNCPYKVRRFNWFQYDDLNIPAFPDFAKVNFQQDDLGRMVLNPDVVVRSRGVMEKCSMCVQRVQTGKLQAKIDGTTVKDQAIQTACSSSCPTDGITFGDLNDKSHRISEDVDNERSYFLMEEVGTQPNVVYHTKVRNV